MIVDKKGRLFGRLNILDLILILIVLAMIAGVCFYFISGGRLGGKNTIPVTYTLEIKNKDALYFDHINIGEQVTDGVTKEYVGKIVGFSKKPAENIAQADNKLIIATPEGKYDGYVEIEVLATVEYPDMLMGKESIKIGKQVAYRSESLAMRGYIVDIDYDLSALRRLK